MADRLRLVTSHTLTWILAGAALGYLVFHYLIDIASVGVAFGVDADSWVDGFWDGLGGLLGGGAGGSGKKGKDFLDNALDPSPSGEGEGAPPVIFPEDGGPPILLPQGSTPPNVPEEDETAYGMFEGLQDFLGEVLGPDYKTAKDKFLDVGKGDDWLGDKDKKGDDD